ncbi:OVARIAN TUMOR DOMAIN-containing deubiquitinating enzyme 2-like isoform X2 [Zingiber officinale]|uniref:OVARIAN TUMOR DOMAIN-containing deubiquitinating enzyme 2-like isoform X2 n=1 Tax=Zingiber officinale TaxID=94328 RepID=UPI001C4C812E|nr:OVARIAN TUMOR DOMAIN-containing deubiquitinating enzyme 2-like isoform X2 [Zingiber officinale]
MTEEKNYRERVMLIYDGLHYDALAMSPYDGAPEGFDQTIFSVRSDCSIGSVENFALNLVKDAQKSLGVFGELTYNHCMKEYCNDER